MEQITKEEFIQRTQKSVPYPLGDQALTEFLDFLQLHEKESSAAAVLRRLCLLQMVQFEDHPLVLFDQDNIQRAFKRMSEELTEEFYEFTFKPQS